VLTKLLAAGLIFAFLVRLLTRTRVRGLGKRPRALIDIALAVMAVAYVVQMVLFTMQ
jgi:hypothetical protein